MDNILKFCVRFYGNYRTSALVYNATLSSNNKLIVTNPKGIAQLVMSLVCSLEVTSSSPINLRATGGLHGR
jgi:hypothetical protein